MNSSLHDGVGAPSPAPPAYSPLTDPADPGNREPPSRELSVNTPFENAYTNGHREPSPAELPPSVNAPLNLPTAMDVDIPPLQTRTMPASAIGDTIDMVNAYASQETVDMYQQQSTSILMALARLSASKHQAVSMPPSTVRPANISLPHPSVDTGSHGLYAQNNSFRYLPGDAPLESFARIEFADSVFQMTTYAVIIGRDQRALQQARKDERRLEEYQRLCNERVQQGLPPPSPPGQDRGKFSKSYVSEEGGMLGPESDGDEESRPTKRRKMSGGGNSASGESQLQQEAAAAEQAVQDDKNLIINRQYVSHTPGAAAVNLSALRPSPYHVPFIGIHSPGPQISTRTKAISREHLKIQFSPERGVFEAEPLHKNGFFCEDVHYKEEKVVLRSGDRLQIKDVDFIFIINGVPRGKTGAEEYLDEDAAAADRRYSEGGKEMSFEFESNHDQEKPSTSDEEAQAQAQVAKEETPSEASERAEEEGPQELDDSGVIETIEDDQDLEEEQKDIKPETEFAGLYSSDLLPMPPKKRGPGRPPKNGIMSKREERLRKKAIQELEKQNRPQPPPGEPPIKRKVGRPRKHPAPEDAPDRPEKRKYKPRKKNGEEGDSDAERAIKEKRREKPKTPPLELRREDYTDEQLQKPNKNYGVLIDEVLTAAPDGLTLKQIYKRIQMKYPFYYFTVDTKGWESSVRHNLIGNDAFKKNDETHLWSRVPGIDIDAGKKRKATSPDHAGGLQNYGQQYGQSPNPAHGAYRNEHVSPVNYQRSSYPASHSHSPSIMNHHPQHTPTPQSATPGQQPPRSAYPTAGQAAVPPHTPGYQEHNASRPPPGIPPGASYSSPYVSKPPTTVPQPGATPHSMARQYQPPNGLPQTNRLPPQSPARGGVAGARPPQPPAPVANTLSLKPAVSPLLLKHVINFKKTVAGQLATRYATPEDVAISAVHRGLGLTTQSMVPDAEGLEKIVLGVFESSRKNLGENQAIHPSLLQALIKFKTTMIRTLEPSLGSLKSERLILSAIDRVLGFAEKTTMHGTEAEMSEYVKAEGVLIPVIQKMVTEHQVGLAAAAAATPAARPTAPVPAHHPVAILNASPAPAPAPARVPPPPVIPTAPQAMPQVVQKPQYMPPPAPVVPAAAPAPSSTTGVTSRVTPATPSPATSVTVPGAVPPRVSATPPISTASIPPTIPTTAPLASQMRATMSAPGMAAGASMTSGAVAIMGQATPPAPASVPPTATAL